MIQPEDGKAFEIGGQTITHRVVANIRAASKHTGVSFSYLMAQAGKESSFEANAGSTASSAAGLFQFTKGTWLELIKNHGTKHGLGSLAGAIQRTSRGSYVVDDPKTRQAILDLRRDPQLSAMMAGEYAKENKTWLENSLGRKVESTDLYMAHFLGPGGAAAVLKAKSQDPTQSAAALLPQAAHKNPSVFYDRHHEPLSVAAVYDHVHHAIARPMQQYALLEGTSSPRPTSAHHATGTAAAVGIPAGATPPKHRVASAKPDLSWPFETGQWPPAYVPALVPGAATAPVVANMTQAAAYTSDSQSADVISAPMPPPPGGLEMKSPVGHLLKDLFG